MLDAGTQRYSFYGRKYSDDDDDVADDDVDGDAEPLEMTKQRPDEK